MEQYIDKSTLVAEIERRKAYYENLQMIKPVYDNIIEDYDELENFIDTLEVKEVDFDAEWERYFEHRGEMATVNVKHLAKHFFELGMQISNKTQKGE